MKKHEVVNTGGVVVGGGRGRWRGSWGGGGAGEEGFV